MFGKIDLSPGNEILIYYLQNGRKKKLRQKGRGSKGSKNGLKVFLVERGGGWRDIREVNGSGGTPHSDPENHRDQLGLP